MLWGYSIRFWESVIFRLSFVIFLLGIGAGIGSYFQQTALSVTFGFLVALTSLTQAVIQFEIGRSIKAPRVLDATKAKTVSMAVASFAGLRVVLGAVPASQFNINLAEQILDALTAANVDAFINHGGVAAAIDPSHGKGFNNSPGVPSGVVAFFMDGNLRADEFSHAFVRALNQVQIAAAAKGGDREVWVQSVLARHPEMDRNNKDFEPVTIVVGDKP